MTYYFTKTVQTTFEDAVKRVTEELAKEGFGVLSDIDVKATFKKKLNIDFRNYRILGACNPYFAQHALEVEDKIGTMLPCSVVVQEIESVGAEVSAIDPVMSMQAVQNPELQAIAEQVRDKLRMVIRKV